MSEPDRLPLDDLVPNETNAKGHAIEQIRASIRRFGFVTPMVIDARTGKLAEGHGRAEALQAERSSGEPAPAGIEVDKDGRWLVPVHREWASANDQEATAFLVAANRLVEVGGWDDQALLAALETARQTPTGLEGIGYLEPDVQALLARIEADSRPVLQGDPDAVPEPPAEPVSKRGDVWLLGSHRVMCGDATSDEDVARVLGGAVPRLVVTDPPYGVAIGAKNVMLKEHGKGRLSEEHLSGDESIEDVETLWRAAFPVIRRALGPGVPYYFFGPQGGDLGLLLLLLREADLAARHVLIWVKHRPSFSMGRLDYEYAHEPIIYGWTEGAAHPWFAESPRSSIMECDRPTASKLHPTMKPVALLTQLIGNSCAPGEVVLDSFLGSGSTLMAAHHTSRICHGLELDPGYVDIIAARYQGATGDKPVLEATGEPTSFLGG